MVNVVLFVLLAGVLSSPLLDAQSRDAQLLLRNVAWINGGLLLFNLLPVYPLDGGQILRSLLWFFLGPMRSLLYATALGLFGIVALVVWFLDWRTLGLNTRTIWTLVIAAYLFSGCWAAFQRARALTAPRAPNAGTV